MKSYETRILIVEDDLDLLHLLKDYFANDFDHVISAVDGISAYLAVAEGNPDIILTDIGMPGFSGLDLVTRLRTEGNNVPILIASGNADRSDAVRALRLGVVDFVEKPYQLEDLRTSVFRALEISSREHNLSQMIEKFGEDSPHVKRVQRMVGLFKVANAKRA